MVSKVSLVAVTGPLAGQDAGFWQWLLAAGYTPLSAANQVRLLAHVSRWLDAEGLSAAGFDEERVAAFLAARRAEGYTCWLSARGIAPLLEFLRGCGLVPMPASPARPVSPVEVVVDEYRRYLAEERGLTVTTVRRDVTAAGVFLAWWGARCDGRLVWDTLQAADVAAFVVEAGVPLSVGSAKLMVTSLRSFLRFLHVSGRVSVPLSGAVLAVAGWRGGSLPRALPAGEVERLLASCDRRRRVGRRDYAMLLLMVRLGLRAGEVAALALDDVDWRAGELVVRGKGRRDERLPLPVDVGTALASYLRLARRDGVGRAVFGSVRAPYRPATDGMVKTCVRLACRRAGLAPVGAHRLRHTAATQMLRSGASLAEIGQVLRHREPATTAIYAKVDRSALRGLALPWPGSAR